MDKQGSYWVASFAGQIEAADQVRNWLAEGYAPQDLYVMADREDQLAVFKEFPGVHISTDAGGDWMDQFRSLFSGSATLKDAFVQMGFESDQATRYYDELKAGKLILVADGSPEQVLNTEAQTPANLQNANEERLALHEEQLDIRKERIQANEVNVRKRTVEEQQQFDVPIDKEEVTVERRQVNEGAQDDLLPNTEPYLVGDEWHIPIVEEKIIITKKKVVTEELIIKKRTVQEVERITETIRKEVAEIDEEFYGDKPD